jgi:hypothetical protein
MATLDNSIENLQQFCALLADTNTQIVETTSRLESHGNEVARLADDVEEKFEGLQSELAEFQGELEKAEQDADEQMERLAESAEQGDQTHLSSSEDDLEGWEDEFESKTEADRGDLDNAFQALEDDGFDDLREGLEAVVSELKQAGTDAEQAFQDLRDAVQGFEQEIDAAENSATQALGDAADALVSEEAGGFKSDVEPYTTSWADTLPEQVETGADGVAEELRAAYDSWGSDAESAGDDLIQSVSTLAQDTAQAIVEELGGELEQAAERALDESMGELATELQAAEATLDAGVEITEDLGPLAGDLAIAHRVIGEIDQALSTLE